MDCKSGPDTLLQEYRKRLSAEYITLCLNADEVTKQLKAKAQKPDDICHKDIWYKLLTDETIYRPYIYTIYMMYTCELLWNTVVIIKVINVLFDN